METKPAAGVSLIELIIVLLILGLLVGLAFPTYQSHVVAARRAQAQTALLTLANAMERHYAVSGSYLGAGSEPDAQGVANAVGGPSIFPARVPSEGGPAWYRLRIVAADRHSYLLQAIPSDEGPQAGDGLLQLDHTGGRGWDRDGDGVIAAAEACWAPTC